MVITSKGCYPVAVLSCFAHSSLGRFLKALAPAQATNAEVISDSKPAPALPAASLPCPTVTRLPPLQPLFNNIAPRRLRRLPAALLSARNLSRAASQGRRCL